MRAGIKTERSSTAQLWGGGSMGSTSNCIPTKSLHVFLIMLIGHWPVIMLAVRVPLWEVAAPTKAAVPVAGHAATVHGDNTPVTTPWLIVTPQDFQSNRKQHQQPIRHQCDP